MEDLKWLTEDIEVRKDSAAANRWELKGHGGGMITAGVGGRLSGLGCDILIIDDPIKNAAEANSETARENLWDWWTSVAHTRLEPGGTAVVIHTRWHQDDMIGRLLREDAHDHRWKVFNFPAIAEENDVLGRKPGDPLWPDRYGVKDLEQIKKSVGTYAWSALYQQRPVPPGGDVFKHEWFSKDRRYSVESMEAEHGGAYRLGDLVVGRDQMRVFQTVDLATSTKSWADYTVIATWGVYWHGTRPLLFLLHVHRKRMEGPTIVMKLQDLIREWGADYARVEKVAFQLAFVQDARRLGLPIREFVPDKDKLSRALAATPYCESGQVVFPQWASWLSDCETELYAFPRATHDDFVDALTMAVEELRGRGCGIAGEIDLSYSRDRRQEIQNCVAEPAAEVVPLESEPMDWQNFSYFSGDGGGGGSSGEKVRDPYRR
jgi:predicted phage terminase large subunit-like protein